MLCSKVTLLTYTVDRLCTDVEINTEIESLTHLVRFQPGAWVGFRSMLWNIGRVEYVRMGVALKDQDSSLNMRPGGIRAEW